MTAWRHGALPGTDREAMHAFVEARHPTSGRVSVHQCHDVGLRPNPRHTTGAPHLMYVSQGHISISNRGERPKARAPHTHACISLKKEAARRRSAGGQRAEEGAGT